MAGIWVEFESGGGTWATEWSHRSRGLRWVADYEVAVPSDVGRIQLHVGCGRFKDGNGEWQWNTNNWTPWKAVSGSSKLLNFLCAEPSSGSPPALTCRSWGRTMLIGMPFSGVWNRDNAANPATHHTSGDWSTDLYVRSAANTSKAVRAKVVVPQNVNLKLKIASEPAVTCGTAGKNVEVKVYRNGTYMGALKYGHLANVPAFQTGQEISVHTVLGKTKWWKPNKQWQPNGDLCWWVTSALGVHTHFTAKNATSWGKSCYRPLNPGSRVGLSKWIGHLGPSPGRSTRCRMP